MLGSYVECAYAYKELARFQHDRNMAPAEREGIAVGVNQSISLDVRGQEKTVRPAPHAPGCRVRVV